MLSGWMRDGPSLREEVGIGGLHEAALQDLAMERAGSEQLSIVIGGELFGVIIQ
jgi:hypothetical protein